MIIKLGLGGIQTYMTFLQAWGHPSTWSKFTHKKLCAYINLAKFLHTTNCKIYIYTYTYSCLIIITICSQECVSGQKENHYNLPWFSTSTNANGVHMLYVLAISTSWWAWYLQKNIPEGGAQFAQTTVRLSIKELNLVSYWKKVFIIL